MGVLADVFNYGGKLQREPTLTEIHNNELLSRERTVRKSINAVTLITTANADLTSKVDDYEVKEKAEAKRAAVNQAITNSKLDPDFVSEVFIEDLMKLDDEEQIQARIKDRLELVESATGEVSGNGTRVSEDSVDDEEQGDIPVFDTDALVKSMKSYKQFI